MKKQFDLNYYLAHPETRVVTRDGRDVRILCTDLRGKDYPIAATCISLSGYGDDVDTFTNEGKVVANASSEHTRDLFFDLPDPAKKKVPLTYEDLRERIKAGKTMWIVPDDNKYAKIILGFNDAYCSIVEGINHHPAGTSFCLEEIMEYHFADGDPCWKEVEE